MSFAEFEDSLIKYSDRIADEYLKKYPNEISVYFIKIYEKEIRKNKIDKDSLYTEEGRQANLSVYFGDKILDGCYIKEFIKNGYNNHMPEQINECAKRAREDFMNDFKISRDLKRKLETLDL